MFMGAILAQKDLVKQREMILNTLWIAGDERIKTDDQLFFSAMDAIGRMLWFHRSWLKKN
jgi:hypothetical protein